MRLSIIILPNAFNRISNQSYWTIVKHDKRENGLIPNMSKRANWNLSPMVVAISTKSGIDTGNRRSENATKMPFLWSINPYQVGTIRTTISLKPIAQSIYKSTTVQNRKITEFFWTTDSMHHDASGNRSIMIAWNEKSPAVLIRTCHQWLLPSARKRG